MSDHGYQHEVAQDRSCILEIWEELFNHRFYTGRSGTFFGYEGLGCIYWHMVSKLLLAVQETYYRSADAAEDPETLAKLAEHYYDIRQGIGATKNPVDYGSFPIDPYSHTPANAGVQQPGMTGQVKEDIIARWGELGIRVSKGQIRFQPGLLRKEEFLSEPATFSYYDVHGLDKTISLQPDTLAFTYCQVPIIYRLAQQPKLQITNADGTSKDTPSLELDRLDSTKVLDRRGEILSIEVSLTRGRGNRRPDSDGLRQISG